MRNHNRPAAVMLAAVVFSAHMALAADAAEPAEPKPSISLSATDAPSGGTVGVIADFKLDPTVHLYKDKVRFEWTKLEGATFAGAVLPKPLRIPDPLADDKTQMIEIYKGRVQVLGRLTVTAKPGEPIAVEGKLLHQSCTDQICFPPAEEAFGFKLVAAEAKTPDKAIDAATIPDGTSIVRGVDISESPVETTEPAAAGEETRPRKTGVAFFLEILGAFLWGIGIGFTPCVYPMIPITAAIIGAKKERGLLRALAASAVYVFGLSLVYALLGLLAASLGTVVSTVIHAWYVVVPIAILFVGLAVTMLAGWNFAMPSGVTAKLQGALAGKKGVVTIFLLGAVGGLVAGPCVLAPLLALLERVFESGQKMLGFWALFAAAWGMGVPLIAFSTASGALPKAGPWMEWIKKLLAFVLFWAALYFLRHLIGDVAYDLSVAVLLVVAAVFLGGFDALTKESTIGDKIKRILGTAAVLCAAVLVIGLVVYRPPPKTVLFVPGTMEDVDAALARGERVILDFHAVWCPNCKTLDKNVFTKPNVLEAASDVTGIKIDVDDHPDVARRYGVKAIPKVVFIEPDGTVRKDLGFSGMKTVDEFVELLKKFKQK